MKKAIQFVLLTTVMLLASSAYALDPEESTFIATTNLEFPQSVVDNEGGDPLSRFLGIRGCRQNIEDNVKISVTFNAASGISFTEDVDGERRLEEVFIYGVESGSDMVNCPGAECTEIQEEPNSDRLTVGTSSARVFLDFTEFVGLSDPDECADFQREYFVRLVMRPNNGDESVLHEARLVLDTERPPSVTLSDVIATESNLELSWELPDDTSDIKSYTLYYSTEAFNGGVLASSVSGLQVGGSQGSNDGGRTRMSSTVSLDPGQTVWVTAASRDQTTNESILPEPLNTNVVETTDFWEYYRQNGGSETGGCSATDADATPLAILVVLGLVALRRRRDWTLAIAGISAGFVILATPGDAFAETDTYGFFEFRLGSYYPSIDEEFEGGAQPFADVFGTSSLFYGEFELGFYFWEGFGKAGTSLHFGYTSVSGNAISDADVGDETSMLMVPLRGSLLYRFDYLAQQTAIPLMLVGKLGLDYVLWSIDSTDGDTASFEGDNGSGGTLGYHAAIGLHFLLDVIDRSSAAIFDLNWGINNSYLFAEFMFTQIDDFGGESFDLSDNIWLFGLSFEF